MKYVDPDGETPVIAAIMVGGAIAGMGGQAVADIVSGNFSGIQSYASAAIGGAVGAPAAMINPLLGGLVAGMVTETSEQAMSSISNEQNNFNAEGILESAALGLITGALPAPKLQGVNIGKGSMEAVTKQITTKSAQGQIQNVSLGTLGKIGAYSAIDGSSGEVIGGACQGWSTNNSGEYNYAPIGGTVRSADSNYSPQSNTSQQNTYGSNISNNSYHSNSTPSMISN